MKYIKCPHCGAEYHPLEIFNPNYIFGKPEFISKTDTGRMEGWLGEEEDKDETYVCDYCNKEFGVHMSVNFIYPKDIIKYKKSKASLPRMFRYLVGRALYCSNNNKFYVNQREVRQDLGIINVYKKLDSNHPIKKYNIRYATKEECDKLND